jgi:preprotein translocase subunit SecG
MPPILYNFLCVLLALISIVLVYVVTIQDSKNDGLQGQIGSTTTSSFKGKAGREEQLNLLTRNIAIAFFAIAILVAISHR